MCDITCASFPTHRLQEKGIPCPEVVLLRKHILVMSFIGEDCKPAPELKEAQLSPELMISAYQQCIHVSAICSAQAYLGQLNQGRKGMMNIRLVDHCNKHTGMFNIVLRYG